MITDFELQHIPIRFRPIIIAINWSRYSFWAHLFVFESLALLNTLFRLSAWPSKMLEMDEDDDEDKKAKMWIFMKVVPVDSD